MLQAAAFARGRKISHYDQSHHVLHIVLMKYCFLVVSQKWHDPVCCFAKRPPNWSITFDKGRLRSSVMYVYEHRVHDLLARAILYLCWKYVLLYFLFQGNLYRTGIETSK